MTAISYPELDALTRRSARTRAAWRTMLRWAGYTVLLLGGLVMAFAFDAGHYLPVRVSLIGLFVVSILAVALCRFAPFSPLTRLMFVLYSTPFLICLGFLESE